jgi:hypothetical protein
MKRRDLFFPNSKTSNTKLPPSGLEPYSGDWTEVQAAHLLRRTIIGPSYENINQITQLGLDNAIDLLLADISLPDPPLNLEFTGDPDVPIGETWVDKPFNLANLSNNYRDRSLVSWTIQQTFDAGLNIREKMVLFWHNHFVISDINDTRFLFRYINSLRTYATGNFKELTKKITIDPAMLRYLNGNSNTKGAPNENYARELLELFTIGKGPLAGSGDYTNYTEEDVIAISKVLTGWVDFGFRNIFISDFGSSFLANRHDNTTKQLSHRFDSIQISNANDNEYNNLIDIIFNKIEVARFISRKLYRYFVYYEISEDVELNIINQMANTLIDNDYNIKPALKLLLSSEHFYDEDRVGCMIKNPIDYTISIFNQFNVGGFMDPLKAHELNLSIYNFTAILQMQYFNPPSVAGWKAYYQEPGYYQLWINSVTLPLRRLITDVMGFTGLKVGDENIIIEPLNYIETLSNPYDINIIIDDLNMVLFSKSLTEAQKITLKYLILLGLPDFEWTEEYNIYKANPNDADVKRTLNDKLKVLFIYMMRMPEYQLS